MKSIYQNKEFAEFWNQKVGNFGEPYKRYVIDPPMFKTVGSLKNKIILELGCGNGYLAPKFISLGSRKLILMDISKYNLKFAKEKYDHPKITFLQQDATRTWKVKSKSVDVIYSNMMLNHLQNIKSPIKEAFRILKKGGTFIFSISHPSMDLFVYAQEKAGLKSQKIFGLIPSLE